MMQTVNIRNIIFQILKKWKNLLGGALVLGLLLGGYQAVDQYSLLTNPERSEKVYEEKLAEYSVSIAKLELLEIEYQTKSDYYNESYLMKVDPLNMYKCNIDLFIDSKFEVLTDKTIQKTDNITKLISAYNSKINYGDLNEEISVVLGNIGTKYVNELVSVNINADGAHISIDVIMDTEYETQIVIGTITSYLYKIFDEINFEVADHDISVMQNSIVPLINEDLRSNQAKWKQEVVEKQVELQVLRSAVEKLSEPVSVEFSISVIVITFIINLLIGGIVGGVLIAGVIFVIVLLSNKLQDESFIEKEFNLPIIAVKPTLNDKINIVDRIIAKKYDDTLFKNDSEFFEFVVEKIKGNKKIHMTGTISTLNIKSIYDNISAENDATVGGYIVQDKYSLQSFNECEGVILVEKRNVTDINKLEREINTIKTLGKEIIGVIVL